MKRGLVGLTLLPVLTALALVRPATAADPVYDQVGVTAILAGVRTDGIVGASGGLVTLDTGSAFISARLDSSPSATVLASPFEPGTLARTVVGQGNGAAGSAVFAVPDAEARYPGSQTKGTCCGLPTSDAPPVTFGAGRASAEAGPSLAKGTSSGADFDIAGALASGPSTSSLSMTTSALDGKVAQTARTTVSKVTVAGVLTLSDVVATADITANRDAHTAKQSLTIGGATVAGQAVEISNDGVTAVGSPLVPGMTLEAATASANAALTGAGIEVHTLGGTAKHDGRSATASTGGVSIDLATPDLPGGVAANQLTIVLGGIELTEVDSLFLPVAVAPPAVAVNDPGVPSTTTTSTTFVPGSPGAQGITSGTAPAIAPPGQLVRTSFTIAGRRISGRTALVAFAGWQMLSLGCATLYAFVERRRRLILMGRTA